MSYLLFVLFQLSLEQAQDGTGRAAPERVVEKSRSSAGGGQLQVKLADFRREEAALPLELLAALDATHETPLERCKVLLQVCELHAPEPPDVANAVCAMETHGIFSDRY